MQFSDVFPMKKPIIAMLHLRGSSPKQVMEFARTEIRQLYDAGVDAILAEDYFGTRRDVERALAYLHAHYPDKLYGVNLLGDFAGSYRMAKQYGAKFMQVDSVCGHLTPEADKVYAAEIAAERDGSVLVLGGVRFKYQPVRSGRSVEEDLLLGMQRCDAIVVTGEGTAMHTDTEKIRRFRQIIGDFPLIVGAGVTLDTCHDQLAIADGAIIGSWLKERGITELPVDPQRADAFMQKVRELR